MRILALDYGEKRIGIAMTDLLKMLANPFENYNRVDEKSDFEHIISIINSHEVDTIIMGLPLNPNGEEEEVAQRVRAFGEELSRRTGLPIKYVDERMSSVVADEILRRKEKDWKKRKEKLDMFAAMVILQDYLDNL